MLPVLTRPARRRSALPDTGIIPSDVAGLTGWWKADAGPCTDIAGTIPATADGAAATRWNDMSGAGRYWRGTGPAIPTYKTLANGINGLPVMRFDGIDDVMTSNTAGFTLASIITNAECCLFVVCKPNLPDTGSGTGYANDAVISDTSGSWGIHAKSTPQFMGYNYDGVEDYANVAFTPGTVYGLRMRHTGGNLSLLRSGAAEVTLASGNTSTMTGSMALGRAQGAQFYSGDIAEVFVYNAQPTAGQLTGLQDYLAGKWGLTW